MQIALFAATLALMLSRPAGPSRSTGACRASIMEGASVYTVRCNDGSLYVGITQRSVEERVSEHNSGLIPGYTCHRRPVELLFSECYARIDEAIAAEKRIKGWSRAKKIAYIRRDFDALQRFARGPRRRAFFDSSASHSAQNDGDGGAASTGNPGLNSGPSSPAEAGC